MALRVLRFLAVGVAVTLSSLVAPDTAQAQTEPRRALVYGDSLTWEAQAGLRSAIEAQLPGYEAILRTSPGIPVCDALAQMRRDGNLNAGVVVMEFVAVPFSPCMRGRDPAQAETEDLEVAVALWRNRGVPVVLVGAPNAPGEAGDPTEIATINRDVAARTGQTFVDSGVMLRDPWSAVYQQRLPCLAGEGAEQGCGTDGTIDVRTPGGGGHFCAVPNVGPCPVYSSGVVRFSAPIAAAAARAAGVQPGPLPVLPATPGVRATARSLFASNPANAGAVKDVPIAQSAVLTPSDVPAAFAEEAPGTERVSLDDRACRTIRTAAAAMSNASQVQTAFVAAGDLASIDNFVSVFPSKRRAEATYRAYAEPDAAECLQLEFTEAVTTSLADPTAQVAVTVASVPLATGDASVGYTVSATVTTAAGSITRHHLIEVQRVGRGVAASVFSNAQSPPPEATALAMSEAIATRLAASVG